MKVPFAVFSAIVPAPLLAVVLCVVPGAAGASAREPGSRAALAELQAREPEVFALLEEDAELARDRYLELGARYASLAEEEGQGTVPFWRAARCYWLAGEILPLDRKEERHESYRRAVELAARGIERDPRCAECMLWKFIAMGRIGTSSGLVAGMRAAPQMAELLDRGIALAPTHRDGPNNSTLGNLHYGSAIFYRVLPDWVWLGWLIGVRGDKDRALEHARTALSIHPQRLDYRVELASQLLCLGTSDRRPEQLDEGRRMLERLVDEEARSVRDERQLAAAEIMLDAPAKSCGFTGEDWVEIDARQAAAAIGN